MSIFKPLRKFAFVGLLAVASMLTGCQQNRAAFNTGIRQSIESVQSGDLQTASKHLDEARPNAKTHEDKRIVASVDELIDGANAMMIGDVNQAKADWSSIPDPHFNREVRVKADAMMGVKVPLVINDKETTK